MNSRLTEIISKYTHSQRDKLIPMLQDVQKEFGYLTEEALNLIADHLGLPQVKVYSVATYYNQFYFDKRGHYHIQVCDGQGCHIENSGRLLAELNKQLEIKPGEVTKDQLFSLEQIPCLGACHLAPAIAVNGELHGQLSGRKLTKLIDHLRLGL